MKLRQLPALLLDWALAFLGIAGAMLCLTTAFPMSLPEGGFFPLLAILLLALCAVFRLRRGDLIAVLVGLVLAALVIWQRRRILSGFLRLWDLLAEFYARGYDYDFLQGHEAGKLSRIWPALWTLGILEVYLCALSVSVWKKTLPCALGYLLCVGPCFVLIDTPPALLPLLLVVFSVTVQALSQSARRRADGEEVRAVLTSSVLAALLLALLLALFPREGFTPPITLEDLTERFSEATEAFDNRGNVAAGLSGNPDDVVLSGLRRLPNRRATVMIVTAPENGIIYLRGSSYDRFDGKLWQRSEAGDWDLRLLYPALNANVPAEAEKQMTVERLIDEDVFYTPYGLTRLPGGAELRGDAWLRDPDEQEKYVLYYSPEEVIALVGTTSSVDAKVKAWYLDLPNETRDGLLAWWDSRTEWITDPGDAIDDRNAAVAEEVAARVRSCARYSRDPAPAPRDRDFCTWFVTEAEEGYCVHYATAAAAMLRALGIPARYVSGYLCHARAGGRTDVTNLDAHAWVEYYSDGSWHKLEPTPGNATEFTGRLGSGEEDETGPGGANYTDPPTEQPTTQPPTEPPTTQPPTEPPETEPRPTEPPTEPPETKPGTPGPGSEEGEGRTAFRFRPWMLVFPAVLLLLALLLLRRRLCAALRERKLRGADPNEQALLLFRRYRRLCRLGREPVNPAAERLAKKAAFSQHEIGPEELSALRQSTDRQAAALDAAPFFRRLYYRYLLAVI